MKTSILLIALILTGMYLALSPGEHERYRAQGLVFDIQFQVIDNSWCYWEVNQIGGSFSDNGYLYHSQIRPEASPIPRLYCDLSTPTFLIASSPVMDEIKESWFPRVDNDINY